MRYTLQRQNGVSRRDLSATELLALCKLGEIGSEDLIQREGDTAWHHASTIPELAELMRSQERPRREWTEIFEEINPLVPMIENGRGCGSGLLISADGLVLTNRHVIEWGDRAEKGATAMVRFPKGGVHRAILVAAAPDWDLALLRCPLAGQRFFDLESRAGRDIRQGSAVASIGHARGLRSSMMQGIVSNPLVSWLECVKLDLAGDPRTGKEFVQVDMRMPQGMSGGPCIDNTGALVGVSTWGDAKAYDDSVNFAIPAAAVCAWVGSIRHGIAAGTIHMPTDAEIHAAQIRPDPRVAVELAMLESGFQARRLLQKDTRSQDHAWRLGVQLKDRDKPLEFAIWLSGPEADGESATLSIRSAAINRDGLKLADLLRFQSKSGQARACLDDDAQLLVEATRPVQDLDASEVLSMLGDAIGLTVALMDR